MSSLQLEWLRRKLNGKTSASPVASSVDQPQEHDPGEPTKLSLRGPDSRPPTPKSDLAVSASHLATEYTATPATILPVPNLDALVPQAPAPAPSPNNSAPIPVGESLAPPTPSVPASTTLLRGLAPTRTVSTVKTPTPSALLGPSQRPEDSYGLKVLAEGIDPVVDLVAVHGLDGDRERTWTAGNGVLWLRDCFPEKIPNVRVLAWGYDGRTHGSTPLSCQSLHDHALALITDLSAERRETNTQERPIIFIAHSVGGIIVKDALIHSNSANKTNLEYHNAIKTSTCGVMYFGTPHQGTDNISWPKILFNTTSPLTRKNKAILKELEENSASLQKQFAQYNYISSDFETKFFYETCASPGGHLIVPRGAAVIPGDTNAETFAIYSDHEGLVKYEGMSDTGFRKVCQCISFMVEEAPAKASENWQRRRLVTAAEKNEGVQTTFNIPFELEYLRNHRFTGRKSLLDEIYSAVKANDASGQSTPIVLHGAGGIGKSQIVVEYLYAYQEERSSVFWINSATRDTAILGFRAAAQRLIKEYAKISLKSQPHYPTIAKELGMIGAVDNNGLLFPSAEHDESIIDGMKLWLSNQENRNWLLVFDNVDDLEALKIETLMPSPAAGTIIMTSRRLDCAHFGLGLEVKEMPEQEGVNLLLKTAGFHIKADNLEKDHIALVVTEKLGCLPLALVQAGAFVAARRISLENFLKIYEKSFDQAFGKKLPSGVWTYKDRSILTTWEISFQAIKELSGNAAELLSLCAFLSNEVQRDMLHRAEIMSEGDINLKLDESLDLLYLYSLAHPQNTDGSFYINPVVHRWAQERLEPSKRIQKAEGAIILVGWALINPAGVKRTKDWDYERGIIPHIDSVTKHARTYLHKVAPRSVMVLAAIQALSSANTDWGRIDEAHWMGSYANKMAKEMLGEHHETTRMTMNNLADMSLEQGQWDEAERSILDVLEARKRSLGHEHLDTLSSMSSPAGIFASQSRWDEAERLYLDVLEAGKRSLGHEHLDTLSCMNNLASVLSEQGRLDEAKRLYLDVLEALKRILGHEHPHTLMPMKNLASIFSEQGRWDEAERLFLDVLEVSKRSLGHEHPDTLSSMSSLARIFVSQSRWDEAERLHLDVLEMKKRSLGHEHPDTLMSMNNLAGVLSEQGRLDEAKRLYLETMKSLGNKHLNNLSPMHNLASVFAKQGRWDEAERLCLDVLEARKRSLGHEHPDTLFSMSNLACIFSKQGRWDEAERLNLDALEAMKRNFGHEHPHTLMSMNNLASIFSKQGRWDEAERLYLDLVEVKKRIFGLGHSATLRLISHLADAQARQGKLTESHELLLEAIDAGERILGKDHLETVNCREILSRISQCRNSFEGLNTEAVFKESMAMKKDDPDPLIEMAKAAEMHMRRDQTQEPEALLEQIIQRRERTLGSEHPDTLSAIADLASTYRTQKRWDKAEKLQQQVIYTRQRILGSEHPDTLSAMMGLAVTYWNQEWWEKAEELEEQVVDVRQKVLGSEHPDTLSAIASLAVSYRMQGLYIKAEELHRQVMETTEKLRGSEHPDTTIAMANLASVYGSQERWEEAEELQKLVVNTRQKQLGENHSVTQRAIASLVDIYRNCGQHEKARDLALHSVEMDQAIPNYDHPSTLEEMRDPVQSYLAQGRAEDLQQLLFETVERQDSGRYDEASILREQVIETL